MANEEELSGLENSAQEGPAGELASPEAESAGFF